MNCIHAFGRRALFFGTALVVLGLAAPLAAQDLTTSRPVVVTTGEAIVLRAPDVAYVTLAVETRAKSPQDAQRQNAELMTGAQDRLARASVPRDALKTVGLSLRQEFDLSNGKQVPRGYVARNTIEARISDVGRVGEIVDAAVQGGATAVESVRFDLKDRDGAEREALRQAVADARGRAQAAVAGAGRTVDEILRIEDMRNSSGGGPRPIAFARAAEAPITPVEPGVIEIRAHVTLTVSMK